MKSLLLQGFGDPTERIRCEEMPAPQPGEGEVRIRVEATPIHPSDLLTARGLYGTLPTAFPATMGNEGVGRVDACGPGVSLELDARVLLPLGCGTWRSHVVVPAAGLVPVPAEADALQLAMASINPPTAAAMLEDVVSLQRGDWVIQNAANSAVGLAVDRIGRERGLHLIHLVRSTSAGEPLRAQGAEHVLDLHAEDLLKQVRAISGKPGPRLGLDAIGGQASLLLAGCLAPGGTLVNYGALSGEPVQLAPQHLIFKSIEVRGFWLVHWLQQSTPQHVRDLYSGVVGQILRGTLHAPVQATFGLEDFPEALRLAEAGGRSGKVLFTP